MIKYFNPVTEISGVWSVSGDDTVPHALNDVNLNPNVSETEPVSDEYTSVVYPTNPPAPTSELLLQVVGDLTGTTPNYTGDVINSVVLEGWFRTSVAPANHYLIAYDGSYTVGALITLTGAWTKYTLTLPTQPNGSAWTVDALNALKIGYRITVNGEQVGGTCSTLYLTVNYTKGIFTMGDITAVTPFLVKVGGTVTLTGTSLGTSTSATITIGSVAVTSFTTYTTTEIVLVVNATATIGLSDILIVNAGTTIATLVDGVYVASTDTFAKAKLLLGRMSRLYIDGQHVGYLEDTVELNPSEEVFKLKTNDSMIPTKLFITGMEFPVKFTLSEVNAPLLAKVMNGVYTVATKTITFNSTPTIVDYAVAFTDAAGVFYFLPRCNVLEPTNLVLRATQNQSFAVSMQALPDDNGVVAQIIFPV